MAQRRKLKNDHLLYADAVGSTKKSGVWFASKEEFRPLQARAMEHVKEQTDWVAMENVVMVINLDPPGIAVIAPNPSLPGLIVLADGSTEENSKVIQEKYTKLVKLAVETSGGAVEAPEQLETPTPAK